MRLDDEGLKQLDALGKVNKVVKLGSFHGIDDAFYLNRYQAPLWALADMKHENEVTTDVALVVGGDMPTADASLFTFDGAKQPEGILLLEREGGILISCDSLQNWVEADAFFSEESATKMREFGFFRAANIGPGWLRESEPKTEDFARLKKLSFRHLISAHGSVLRDDAHQQLSATFQELLGVE